MFLKTDSNQQEVYNYLIIIGINFNVSSTCISSKVEKRGGQSLFLDLRIVYCKGDMSQECVSGTVRQYSQTWFLDDFFTRSIIGIDLSLLFGTTKCKKNI